MKNSFSPATSSSSNPLNQAVRPLTTGAKTTVRSGIAQRFHSVEPVAQWNFSPWTLPNGMQVQIRPVCSEDESLMAQFYATLSDETVVSRYFYPLRLEQRVAHEWLSRQCVNYGSGQLTMVVEYTEPKTGKRQLLAVGELARRSPSPEAEFAIVVSDQYQHLGLGTEVLRRLIAIGRAEQLRRITGLILANNHTMQHVCAKLGFRFRRTSGDATTVTVELELD